MNTMYDDGYENTGSSRQAGLPAFVRIGGLIWLGLIVAILLGTVLAPYMGRAIDMILHQTSHRAWQAIHLEAGTQYFNLSTPLKTISSYYSTLSRQDGVQMDRLSTGTFREQMRQRLAHAETTSNPMTYRSFVIVEREEKGRAVVVEKFHLFWDRGLRFRLERTDDEWRIIRVGGLD